MTGYLEQLTLRLARGAAELPEPTRRRHAEFFLAAQRNDGGFAGREGRGDLYYTSFALRGLAVLGELNGEPARRAVEFLRARLSGETPIIDFLSLIFSASLVEVSAGIDLFADRPPDWRDAVAVELDRLRRDDGGYAKGADGAASSTYHTFLVTVCRQLIDRPAEQPERMVDFLMSQSRDDGGFVEIRAMRRSGANPTAAAVGLLRILDAVDDATRQDAADFLAEMQNEEGGLRANTRIPIADLLSTFTGLLTLVDLDALERIDAAAARRYAESLEQPTGGFFAAAWDQLADVEYSFYGLATLALLADADAS